MVGGTNSPKPAAEALKLINMFVTSIEYGSPNADGSVPSPDWNCVEMHLRSLDGDNKDGVILASSGSSYLGISGGRSNQYVVAGYVEGRGSVILANGPKGEGVQQVVVNGDFNDFASEFVVGLEDAIAAAREFFQSGSLVRQFKWENQL